MPNIGVRYYPFGLKQKGYNSLVTSTNPGQKYRFGGKELQDENIGGFKLNMYDYGARNYDPALGRWMNIDPLAETSRRFSPYTYALNNPVFFIDPDGMKAEAGQTANIYYDFDEGGYRTQSGKVSTQEEALAQSSGGDSGSESNSSGPGDPPTTSSITDFFKSLFNVTPKSEQEAEQSNTDRDFFQKVTDYYNKANLKALEYLSTLMTLPLSGPEVGTGKVALESKGLYTVVKESATKYSVLVEEGSATSFYKTLNPNWNGVYQYTKDAFSTTSFTTATGSKVILNTASKSTGQASVKIIEKSGIQILFRFPKI